MAATAPYLPSRPVSRCKPPGTLAGVSKIVPITLIILCAAAYFFSAISIDLHAPLWMDEVLAKWMSELNPKTMWLAMNRGCMSSPLTYFYVLKGARYLLGSGNIALRLPSTIAVFITSLSAYLLMRRRFSLPVAGVAMVLCLETGLFGYATQIREYTLVTASFALAVLLWDRTSVTGLRLVAIGFFLGLCGYLHFYGVLLIISFALMEIVRSIGHRQIRLGVWAAILTAGLAFLVWLPLIHNILKVTQPESASPFYFAKPTFASLIRAYFDLALGGRGVALLLVLAILLVTFLVFDAIRADPLAAPTSQTATSDLNLSAIMFSTSLVPLIVFIYARITTGAFNPRYATAASFGFALLFAYLIAGLRRARIVSCVLLCASVLLLLRAHHQFPSSDRYGMTLLSETGDSSPIVVGEGLAFLELQEAAPPKLRSRLVYLNAPRGVFNPDTTNEDAVDHWAEFRPELKVSNAEDFLRSNPHFYVLHSSYSTDVITPWLVGKGALKPLWGHGDVWFFVESNTAAR